MQWTCSKCGAQNEDKDYRCCTCNAVKPYLLVPAQTDSPPPSASHSPPSSPTHSRSGGLDEGRTSFRPRPAVPVTEGARSSSPPGIPLDLWGGARPKRRAFGNVSSSSPEERQVLIGGEGLALQYSQPGRSADQLPIYQYGADQGGRAAESTDRTNTGGKALSFPDKECRLILIGRTGNGKSSAGNTIVGVTHFQEGVGFNSETSTCQMKRVTRFGIEVEVVDTPGFFDTSTPEQQLLKEIRKCVGMVSPGPHALALVIGGRFTSEQVDTVEQVKALFGPQVIGHMLVIFTFGDQLSRGQGEGRCDDAIRDNLERAPPELKKLIKEDLDNRYVVFNNRGTLHEKEGQVQELLLMVGEIVRRNRNKPFTASLLEQCEKAIHNYEARVLGLLNARDNMTRQQVRLVFRKLMDKDENTKEVLENLLQTQAVASEARRDLEDTKEIMEKMIRDHKAKTDELMSNLAQRRKCTIL